MENLELLLINNLTERDIMKTLELISLTIKNFKGIKNLTINFNKITSIYGMNATGKTTIPDAFRWLLFDKNSEDKKDFSIIPIGKDGETIHGIETEINADFSINGKQKNLQKIYIEKWTKKRGEATDQLTGHTTKYYIDEVPLTEAEYKKAINDLIAENLFKFITDPLYFAQDLKWTDRRQVLMNFNGDITSDSIISSNSELESLRDLLSDSDIDSLRKTLSAKKKKLNDDIKAIPFRIDEANNSIKDFDFTDLKTKLIQKELRFDNIEKQITKGSLVDSKRAEKINRQNELCKKLDEIEFDAANEVNKNTRELRNQVETKESRLKLLNENIIEFRKSWTSYDSNRKFYASECEIIRKEWFDEHDKTLDFLGQFICPTCNRLLDEENVEKKKLEMQENFNANKAKNLESITKRGKEAAEKVKHYEQKLIETEKDIESTEIQIESLTSELETLNLKSQECQAVELPDEHYTLKKEFDDLKAALDKPTDAKNNLLDLSTEKKELQKEIDGLKSDLKQNEINQTQRARIQELSDQERKLAQQIADLEGTEFLCEKFIKTKVGLLESEINSHFSFVTWKLFEVQINSGIQECCYPLINGVPFTDANHAAKVNAGIDIINALTHHYQVSAPIFIDGRESVVGLVPTDNQVINLIVSADDKKLRIN